jgi:hypothetical protein
MSDASSYVTTAEILGFRAVQRPRRPETCHPGHRLLRSLMLFALPTTISTCSIET